MIDMNKHSNQISHCLFLSQDLDTRLTEVAAGVNNLQIMSESSVTQEMLPADVILSVSAAFKELARYFTSFQHRNTVAFLRVNSSNVCLQYHSRFVVTYN